MARLVAKTPFEGLLPMDAGAVSVTEVDPGAVTFIQPLKGKSGAVSAALSQAVGAGLPGPGEALTGREARLLWCGPGQALVLGARVAPEGAVVVDQSDGWAVARIAGGDARRVLARLTPLDVRASVFIEGRTARTLLGHMTAQITPVGADAVEVMVFRSVAGTLAHDLRRAMEFVAGRARIG